MSRRGIIRQLSLKILKTSFFNVKIVDGERMGEPPTTSAQRCEKKKKIRMPRQREKISHWKCFVTHFLKRNESMIKVGCKIIFHSCSISKSQESFTSCEITMLYKQNSNIFYFFYILKQLS